MDSSQQENPSVGVFWVYDEFVFDYCYYLLLFCCNYCIVSVIAIYFTYSFVRSETIFVCLQLLTTAIINFLISSQFWLSFHKLKLCLHLRSSSYLFTLCIVLTPRGCHCELAWNCWKRTFYHVRILDIRCMCFSLFVYYYYAHENGTFIGCVMMYFFSAVLLTKFPNISDP